MSRTTISRLPASRTRRTLRGFSLVEALFAVLILSLGMTGLWRILDQSRLAHVRMAQRAGAYSVANDRAVAFAALGYEALAEKLNVGGSAAGEWLNSVESGEMEVAAREGSKGKPYKYDIRLLWVGEQGETPRGIRVSCLAWSDAESNSAAALALRQEFFVDIYAPADSSAAPTAAANPAEKPAEKKSEKKTEKKVAPTAKEKGAAK